MKTDLAAQLQQLGLRSLPASLNDFLARAAKSRWSHRQLLEHLVAAESDDPSRAWTYFEKSRSKHPLADLSDADWYVYGRILESYGMRDDALAAYRAVKPIVNEGPSSYDFAQRGLARLGAKSAEKLPKGR